MNRSFLKARRALIAAAAIAAIGSMSAQAANITWVGSSGSFWDLAANWNPALPGAPDDALLGAFDTTFRSGVVTIRSFTGTGIFSVTGGTLTFTNASSIGGLAMTGGTLGGAGAVTISGLASWTTGEMTGAGITNANGGMALGDGNKLLTGGRVLNTAGTTTWSGATGDFSNRILVG
ncbi:MAG: hypothetical protein Q8L49_02950, partial [Burkholderiaceae bacterium]|nr:hypothetical protein [Burkholderiaceae bacterium]